MSIFAAGPHLPVIVRANDAEYLPDIRHYLLADSSATNGARSAHRVQLGRSENGAVPHRHNNSSELFFMLDGTLDVLVGSEILPRVPATCLSSPRNAITPSAPIQITPPTLSSSSHLAWSDSTTSGTSPAYAAAKRAAKVSSPNKTATTPTLSPAQSGRALS